MKKGISIDGSLVKKLRKAKKWTQKELGSTVMKKNGLKEIHFRTIQRLETEVDYGCSQTIIKALATVFGVDQKELLMPTSNIENPKGSWTKARCALEAKKYFSRSEFRKNSPLAFDSAYKNKWLEAICRHMNKNYDKDSLIYESPGNNSKALRKFKTIDDIPADEETGEWYQTVEQLGDTWSEYFSAFLNEYDTLEFNLEEEQIRYIEKQLPFQKNNYLRDMKFQPIVFKTIISKTKETIKESDYELFCKAHYNYHSEGSEYRLKVLPGFRQGRRVFSLDGTNLGFDADDFKKFGLGTIETPRKEMFLESLDDAHGYSIEYDLPEEEDLDMMEKMVKYIEMIEKYFNSNLSQSEELRFKFELSKVLKSFQGSPFKILYNNYVQEDNEFESESSNLRILIKKTSNRNFIKKDEFLDQEYSEFYSTFKRHKFRDSQNDNNLDSIGDKMGIPKDLLVKDFPYIPEVHNKKTDHMMDEFFEHWQEYNKKHPGEEALKPETIDRSTIFEGWALQKIGGLHLIVEHYADSIVRLQKQIQLLDSKI